MAAESIHKGQHIGVDITQEDLRTRFKRHPGQRQRVQPACQVEQAFDPAQLPQGLFIKSFDHRQPFAGGGVKLHLLPAENPQGRVSRVMRQTFERFQPTIIRRGDREVSSSNLVKQAAHRFNGRLETAPLGYLLACDALDQPGIDVPVSLAALHFCNDLQNFIAFRHQFPAVSRLKSSPISRFMKPRLCRVARRGKSGSFILNRWCRYPAE